MFLAYAALCLQTQTDYLVVDGLLVGSRSTAGWSKPQNWTNNQSVTLTQVSENGSPVTLLFGRNPESTAIVALDKQITGVFYSGKAWYPRTATIALSRDSALSATALLARNRGIDHPRPYLSGVWDVDLDGT